MNQADVEVLRDHLESIKFAAVKTLAAGDVMFEIRCCLAALQEIAVRPDLPSDVLLALEQNKRKELGECYDLLLKTARRCARDLKHACDEIREDAVVAASEYKERYQFYSLVLGGTSEYRVKLYREIEDLEFKLQQAQNRIAELEGRLPPNDPNQQLLPF